MRRHGPASSFALSLTLSRAWRSRLWPPSQQPPNYHTLTFSRGLCFPRASFLILQRQGLSGPTACLRVGKTTLSSTLYARVAARGVAHTLSTWLKLVQLSHLATGQQGPEVQRSRGSGIFVLPLRYAALSRPHSPKLWMVNSLVGK